MKIDPPPKPTQRATILGGDARLHVFDDETFNSIIDATGQWRIGGQLAPNHVPH